MGYGADGGHPGTAPQSERAAALGTVAGAAGSRVAEFALKSGPFESTDHCICAKALAGDATDGVPGVKGVGLKTAARIIRDHGSLEALWARHDAGEPIKGVVLQRAAGRECLAGYVRNLKLIDWRLAPPLRKNFDIAPVECEFRGRHPLGDDGCAGRP